MAEEKEETKVPRRKRKAIDALGEFLEDNHLDADIKNKIADLKEVKAELPRGSNPDVAFVVKDDADNQLFWVAMVTNGCYIKGLDNSERTKTLLQKLRSVMAEAHITARRL